MHPILFEIPLNWVTALLLGIYFGASSIIRHRFELADADTNYLATFLGLNVKWGVLQRDAHGRPRDWSGAIVHAAFGLVAFGAVFIARYVAGRWFQTDRVPVHNYGLMMATAFLVAIWLGTREAVHEQLPGVKFVNGKGRRITLQPSELVSDLSFYIFISGLVGSRALYIVTVWDSEYASNPLRMFNPVEGGLVWYGGLIAATGTAAWFIRKHNVAFLPYADLLVPGVSIAHGVGRLGCFAAGCCFGNLARPGFPLAVRFPPGSPAAIEHLGNIKGAIEMSNPVYPTQIMEAAGELAIFCILLWVRSRKRFHGQVVLTYFFTYAILRTIMEMFRGDTIRGFVFRWPSAEAPMLLSTSQAVSILVAVAGITATIAISRSRNSAR